MNFVEGFSLCRKYCKTSQKRLKINAKQLYDMQMRYDLSVNHFRMCNMMYIDVGGSFA